MTDTELHLTVTGMHCASCGLLVDDNLLDVPGVSAAQTSVRDGRTVVHLDTARASVDDVVAAIAAAGYAAQLAPGQGPPAGT